MSLFTPDCLPLFIGSLPMDSHREAAEFIFNYTPTTPIWPQLPRYKEEGMVLQYLPGMPGVVQEGDRVFVDSESEACEEELLTFYEEYLLAVEELGGDESSRFALGPDVARGFYEFLDLAGQHRSQLQLVKGQTTGPITFATGLTDRAGRSVYYHDQLRDAAVKLLALKARYQVVKMKELGCPVMMFFDEPALAGLGSSAYITITQQDITSCLSEVFEPVKALGALTGVHVCANTEWPVVFESGTDVVSFDAYSYFDKFILYPKQLKSFLERGGILAWGIVPTSTAMVDGESVESLVEKWYSQSKQLAALGFSESLIGQQTLITPSCGTGTVPLATAVKVAELLSGVAAKIRSAGRS